MKFQIGDSIDSAHCTALKHEFLRCEEAFKEFESFATTMILKKQAEETGNTTSIAGESRFLAYKTYNAYTRFIHHLYEFLVGALARETGNTGQIDAHIAERYIMGHANRILQGKRSALLNGTAPSWENHISAYAESVPAEFAQEFRKFRNKLSGHVKHERSTMSLSRFYSTYHQYLYMLYWNCLDHWGSHRNKEFPDLREITDFSVLITSQEHP
ncbi:hypothetical protein [Agrobacterium sp. T29]|uniref:hypothetical protein n=1 Tax=Agrobacterium sp. T29 TaxID=2580515 RepID=UPI00115E27AE|nr:hypothetical protein [Agrobacterium sp. T29]